jgi:hypothetical protein
VTLIVSCALLEVESLVMVSEGPRDCSQRSSEDDESLCDVGL